MSESTKLECPGCHVRYVLKKALPAGRTVHCKKCRMPLKAVEDELQLQGESTTGSWEIPVRLGKFTMEGEIARGGMGVVYKARQEGLDRRVAIKMLLPGPASSPDAIKRFDREARAVAKLRHPNIVSVHETGEYRGMPFFTMDYVDGKPLDVSMREFPLTPKRAAQLTRQIARGLYYAHSKGIIHRDVKPSNILIDKEGQPRITDFGLAKEVDSRSMLSITGDVMGTPAYMSPEQAEGKVNELGPLTDVYSLGAVFYRMLTGRPPFDGPTIASTINQVVHEETREPTSINNLIPSDLSAICMKALEKQPARRYRSAEELARDLDAYLAGDPVSAKKISKAEKIRRRLRKNKLAFRITAASVAVALLAVIAIPLLVRENYLELAERNLKSEDLNRRQTTTQALLEDLSMEDRFSAGERGEAVRILQETLSQDTAADTRRIVVEAMDRYPAKELWEVVIGYLNEKEPKELLLRTVQVLARHEVGGAIKPVSKLLEDEDHEIHRAAIRYFKLVPTPEVYYRVAKRITDPHCKRDASDTLHGLYNDPRIALFSPMAPKVGGALGALGEAVHQANERLEQVMEFRPGQKPKDQTHLTIHRLSSADAEERMKAAVELGMHRSNRAAQPLLKACEDPDDGVAQAAGASLRLCGASQVREPLEKLLHHERSAVRIAASSALAGLTESISAIGDALKSEKDETVREVLVESIRSQN